MIITHICNNNSVILACIETYLGNIANIALPIFEDDLYANLDHTRQKVIEAISASQSLGITHFSLTGLLPSAIQFDENFRKNMLTQGAHLTTGHSTTCAAMLLNIQNILKLTNRTLSNETLGILGLGSIGSSTLHAILETIDIPKEIILCDLLQNADRLKHIRQTIIQKHPNTIVNILPSSGTIPDDFYQAKFIIGATNVPNVIDVNKLECDTIIVDDSAPPCFNLPEMITRYETHSDIIFLEGGLIKLPQPFRESLYLPDNIDLNLSNTNSSSDEIGGCVFSSLINQRFNLPSHSGAQIEQSPFYKTHLDTLIKESCQASRPQCKGYLLHETESA